MPRLTENQRLRAVGMMETGMAQNEVARHFGVHRNTISSLWRRFQQNGNTRDLPRSGRPRVTSRQQDNHIRLTHLRNRFQSSSLTARNHSWLTPNQFQDCTEPTAGAQHPAQTSCHTSDIEFVN